MSDYVNNPTTGRMIKIGGKTHRSLINSGVLKNTRRDPRVLYTLDHGDDVHAIKQQLRETANLKKNESMKYHPSGKYKGKIVKTHKIGRKSKHSKTEKSNIVDSESEDEDELLSLYKKLNIAPPSTTSHNQSKNKKKHRRDPESSESDESESDQSESDQSESESESDQSE